MAYNETPTDWIAMLFKNREFRIRAVKTNRNDEDLDSIIDDVFSEDSVDRIEAAGMNLIKHAAIAAVAVFGVIKVVDTLGEIAVKKTRSADQK